MKSLNEYQINTGDVFLDMNTKKRFIVLLYKDVKAIYFSYDKPIDSNQLIIGQMGTSKKFVVQDDYIIKSILNKTILIHFSPEFHSNNNIKLAS